jgi:hypothetical protein
MTVISAKVPHKDIAPHRRDQHAYRREVLSSLGNLSIRRRRRMSTEKSYSYRKWCARKWMTLLSYEIAVEEHVLLNARRIHEEGRTIREDGGITRRGLPVRVKEGLGRDHKRALK